MSRLRGNFEDGIRNRGGQDFLEDGVIDDEEFEQLVNDSSPTAHSLYDQHKASGLWDWGASQILDDYKTYMEAATNLIEEAGADPHWTETIQTIRTNMEAARAKLQDRLDKLLERTEFRRLTPEQKAQHKKVVPYMKRLRQLSSWVIKASNLLGSIAEVQRQQDIEAESANISERRNTLSDKELDKELGTILKNLDSGGIIIEQVTQSVIRLMEVIGDDYSAMEQLAGAIKSARNQARVAALEKDLLNRIVSEDRNISEAIAGSAGRRAIVAGTISQAYIRTKDMLMLLQFIGSSYSKSLLSRIVSESPLINNWINVTRSKL